MSIAHALPTVEIRAGTDIQVSLANGGKSGLEAPRARLTLRSDAGAPLGAQPVSVKVLRNGDVIERSLVTDDQGIATLTVPAGTVSVSASYAGGDGYASSFAPAVRLEAQPSQPATGSLRSETLGLWPWLVSLVMLGGLAWFRAGRAKRLSQAPPPRSSRAPLSRPPARLPPPPREPSGCYVLVVDAEHGLPISGARLLSPEGPSTPLSVSAPGGHLRLPKGGATSAYLVQALGYEPRTVFMGQLASAPGGHVVLPLRSLRSTLWERLQRTAGNVTRSAPSAPRSPAQWARHHGAEAATALDAIEQALFAAPPMSPAHVDALDAALRDALRNARGPESPAEPGDDR